MARSATLALIVALLAALPARAGEAGSCDAATLTGSALQDCLAAAEQKSRQALETTMQAALASIAARPGVFDTQRARWRSNLMQSQDLWTRFRNFECQEVAPFEGQAATANVAKNRSSVFAAKSICSIRLNEARSAEIAARYSLQQ